MSSFAAISLRSVDSAPRGTYTTRGREITFATTSADGTVDYHGVSRAPTELVLGWHSHINGAEESEVVYTFVEFGPPTT
jgi:hypothetical protein